MLPLSQPDLASLVGRIPYRLALAGGWIDQPFVSRLNPRPPGSMVTVGVEPTLRFMERSGMATGTRKVARRLWGDCLPDLSSAQRMAAVRELYAAENEGQPEPSGSQDMIGLIWPGVSRLDYDFGHEGGYFPRHVENCCDEDVLAWLEQVVYLVAVAPRPPGYGPLGEQHLDPGTIARLGETGRACYDAILSRDLAALGASLNACMAYWASLLPNTVRHETIDLDLPGLLRAYQASYPGAMYSGCGGGYLYVVSDEPVPGGFRITIRREVEAR